jgi:hypothetical protein
MPSHGGKEVCEQARSLPVLRPGEAEYYEWLEMWIWLAWLLEDKRIEEVFAEPDHLRVIVAEFVDAR